MKTGTRSPRLQGHNLPVTGNCPESPPAVVLPHDSGYKYLFSNKDIFCQLLTRFVDEPHFRHLKPEDVDQLEHSFISDEFLNRESDIIYKVKLPETGTKIDADTKITVAKTDAAQSKTTAETKSAARSGTVAHEFYIYVLLEFQSSADKSIPVRMLLYLLQFYDLLLRNSQKGLLPAVFPLLLYNGKDPWKVAGNAV